MARLTRHERNVIVDSHASETNEKVAEAYIKLDLTKATLKEIKKDIEAQEKIIENIDVKIKTLMDADVAAVENYKRALESRREDKFKELREKQQLSALKLTELVLDEDDVRSAVEARKMDIIATLESEGIPL